MTKHMALVLFGFTALVLAVWGQGIVTGSMGYMTSVSRLKKVDAGLMQYANDWDDVLPVGPGWMDVLTPFVPDQTNFQSPAIGSLGYGYALNSAIVGKSLAQLPHPETTVTVFDSTDLSRNAVEGLQTLPSPPRYGNSNTIGFADGHVKDDTGLPPRITPYQLSRRRLANASVAMVMYASDYDDRLPLANQWMDELYPYTKSYTVFRSPAIERLDPTKFGYALNADLAGARSGDISDPSTTISLFDSTVLTKNATAWTSTLPSPPRYPLENTIAYADGHVH